MNHSLIAAALSAWGVEDIPGSEHNITILGWLDQLGFPMIADDETPWCSTFVNWVAMVTGHERSCHLSARSWLDVGKTMPAPMVGDVVILWRDKPESTKGHVGFYVGEDLDSIRLLGGNQDNKVCIKEYPKDRVLGYRRLGTV